MTSLSDKPTVEHIQQTQSYLSGIWSDAHGVFRQVDPYYDRTFALWESGSTRPNLHPMKPRSIIDTALDQLMGHEARVHRFGESDDKKIERDEVEKAVNAIFRQAALQEISLSFKQAGKHLLTYGYTVIEDSLDSLSLSVAKTDKPEQERNEDKDDYNQRVRLWEHRRKTVMPFRIRAPHPVTVLMDPMRKEPRVAIKIDAWTAQDLVDITRHKKEQQRGEVVLFEARNNPFELVRAYEYWTEDWHALMTDTLNLLIVEPNTWGFVPFSHAFSGWGKEPSDRTAMNPKYLAVGMLQHAMDDLRMHAQAIAGRHNALIDATFPKQGTTENAAEIEEQMATADTLELPNEGALWSIRAPNLPRWLENLTVLLDKDMEEGTFTRSIGGIRDVGVSTVGQQAILNTAGHRKFVPINQQMEHLGTKSLEHILQWIDILDLNLTIEGHTIKRSDIGGDYTGRVTFQVVDPVLRLQERQQALTEWQAGAMSLETLWSVSGLEDAAGERERLAEDQVYAHPLVIEQFAKLAAQRLGLAKLLSEEPDEAPVPNMARAGMEGGGMADPGMAAPPPAGILGPDGQPLASTLGTAGPRQAASQIGNALRQPITGNVVSPGRTGANLAG